MKKGILSVSIDLLVEEKDHLVYLDTLVNQTTKEDYRFVQTPTGTNVVLIADWEGGFLEKSLLSKSFKKGYDEFFDSLQKYLGSGVQQNQIAAPPTQDRICIECKKSIPFDADMCPYCGKSYKTISPACPKCSKAVSGEFAMCPFCGQGLKSTCPKCNKQVSPDFAMCPFCGQQLKTSNTCKKCSKELNPEFAICPFCGEKR